MRFHRLARLLKYLTLAVLPLLVRAEDFTWSSSLADRAAPYSGLSSSCSAPSPAVDKFTIAVLPDTQYYAKYDPQTYELQAREIAAELKSRNIKLVVHVGDIVNNWDDIGQWKAARKAHKIFDDAGVPYVVTTGNHDVETRHDVKVHDATNFENYFGFGSVMYPNNWLLQPWLNYFGSQVENNHIFFQESNVWYGVMSLEFAPRKDAVCWAKKGMVNFPSIRWILVTHCYQDAYDSTTRTTAYVKDCDSTATPGTDGGYNIVGLDGPALWNELIKPARNVVMVLSGHVTSSAYRQRQQAPDLWQVDEILTDLQFEKMTYDFFGSGLQIDHGRGFMRWIEFVPSAQHVNVALCSVYRSAMNVQFDRSEYRSKAYDQPDNRFTIDAPYLAPTLPSGLSRPREALERFHDREINAVTNGSHYGSRVAVNKNGEWVSTWMSEINGQYSVRYRQFDSDGCVKFDETQVNSTDHSARSADVGIDDAGNTVVVWTELMAQGYVIKARFGSYSQLLNPERVIRSVASSPEPVVSMNGQGALLIVWVEPNAAGMPNRIMGQYYTSVADVAPRMFTVATSRGMVKRPGASVSLTGDFVIAWREQQYTGVDEVRFVAFHANGSAYLRSVAGAAHAMQPNSYSYMAPPSVLPRSLSPVMVNQGPTQILFDSRGNIVLVWETYEGNRQKIVGRSYSAAGASPQGVADLVSSATTANFNPVIARLGDSKFALVWTQLGGMQLDIHAKTIYHLPGIDPQTPAFFVTHNPEARVNSVWLNNQWRPGVGSDSADRFIVTWDDDLDGDGSWQILGRGCHGSLYDELCEWPDRY